MRLWNSLTSIEKGDRAVARKARTLQSIFCCTVACALQTCGFVATAADSGSQQQAEINTGEQVQDLKLQLVSLLVELLEMRNTDGYIRILVFNQAEGFPDEPKRAVFEMSLPAAEGQSFKLQDLQPGQEYALSITHDENGDGRLNTNFIGIPQEGIAVSGNPRMLFGPPSYDDCRFVLTDELASGQKTLEINMKYY